MSDIIKVTPQQIQILGLTGQGLTPAEIAYVLERQQSNIEISLDHLCKKFKVGLPYDAYLKAVELHFIEPVE